MTETETIRIEYDVLRLCREIAGATADCERPDYKDEIAEIRRLTAIVNDGPHDAEEFYQRLRDKQRHLAALLQAVDPKRANVTFPMLRCLDRMDFPPDYKLRLGNNIIECDGCFTFNVWSVHTMMNLPPSRQSQAVRDFIN